MHLITNIRVLRDASLEILAPLSFAYELRCHPAKDEGHCFREARWRCTCANLGDNPKEVNITHWNTPKTATLSKSITMAFNEREAGNGLGLERNANRATAYILNSSEQCCAIHLYDTPALLFANEICSKEGKRSKIYEYKDCPLAARLVRVVFPLNSQRSSTCCWVPTFRPLSQFGSDYCLIGCKYTQICAVLR